MVRARVPRALNPAGSRFDHLCQPAIWPQTYRRPFPRPSCRQTGTIPDPARQSTVMAVSRTAYVSLPNVEVLDTVTLDGGSVLLGVSPIRKGTALPPLGGRPWCWLG